MTLPLAHAGHWFWIAYLIPVLVVVGGIVKSTFSQRRRQGDGATPAERKGSKR